MSKKIRFITEGAVIAALYVVLSLLSAAFGLSGGVIQIRFSEALCIMPMFTPAAIPGLFIGCLLTNILTGCLIWDVIFGSIATLIGAVGTFHMFKNLNSEAKRYLALLPPILSNMIVVPPILSYCYEVPDAFWFIVLTVGIGEILSVGVLGSLLYTPVKKTKLF